MSYLIPELGSLLRLGTWGRRLRIVIALLHAAFAVLLWFLLSPYLGPVYAAGAASAPVLVVYLAVSRVMR